MPASQLDFLRQWCVTDVAWPTPPDSYDACMANVKDLLHYGVRVHAGLDALDPLSSFKQLGIQDLSSVGLVLWCGAHPRRHDGKNQFVKDELQFLDMRGTDFIAAALDILSSSLPQATVIACDKDGWANDVVFSLDFKPLVTFKTYYGCDAIGGRFKSEASGLDRRHIRHWNSDAFLGCGLVGPFLKHLIGQRVVDIPRLAMHVAQAGLYVIFVGEFTCAQSHHCLMRALQECSAAPVPRRMLCERPWHELPVPRRGWKRGNDEAWSLQEYRDDAKTKFSRRYVQKPLHLSNLHAAHNWRRALSRGRAAVSDFGDAMRPSRRPLPPKPTRQIV